MNRRVGVGVAFALIIVPLIIYFLAKTGKPNYRGLAYYGEKVAPDGKELKDTLYYTVPDYHVISQSGKSVSQKNFSGSIYIANFFFASCKDVCPRMNAKLATVYKSVLEKKFDEIKFISFSVDPQDDSVPVLKNYAKKFNADPERWMFVTGKPEDIVNAGKGFLLPVSMEDTTVDHSEKLILVDKNNHIRGFYDGLDEVDIGRLNDEIKVLLYEYHKK